MTSKAEDKVEIVVQVESKDTSSKVILIMLIIVLFGLVIAVMMRGDQMPFYQVTMIEGLEIAEMV